MPLVLNTNHEWFRTINRSIKLLAGVTAGAGGGVGTQSFSLLADFTVGDPGAPVGGDTSYANPALAGKNLLVFRNGNGFLTGGADFNPLPAGGFDLLGFAFSCGERWIIFGT